MTHGLYYFPNIQQGESQVELTTTAHTYLSKQ